MRFVIDLGTGLVAPYLKQPLLLDQHAFLQAPEVQMRLAACHYDAAVCRVEVCAKHRLVGALKAKEMLLLHVRMQVLFNAQYLSF